jgi:hypothetical protein
VFSKSLQKRLHARSILSKIKQSGERTRTIVDPFSRFVDLEDNLVLEPGR